MDRQKEEMFDAMIRIAGSEAMRRDAEAMPPEDDIDVTFSPKFERKMNKLLKRHQRKIRSLPTKILRVATAGIAIIALTFTSAFALMPPFRERVVKAVVEWTGISAGFTFAESDGIRPGYIPDGFEEVDCWESDMSIEITYLNGQLNEICYWRKMVDGRKLSVDSEHSDYRVEMVNGFELHIFTSNTEGYPSYVLLNDNAYAYFLSGDVPVGELILMAESLPIENQFVESCNVCHLSRVSIVEGAIAPYY